MELASAASAEEWRKIAPAYASWRVVEMTDGPFFPDRVSHGHGHDTDAARLAWCLEAAVAESAAGSVPHDRSDPSEPWSWAGR